MPYNIDSSKLRNERKFIFFEPIQSVEKLISFIGAKELYNSRMVNSIYYDTYFHKNFHEAVDGIMRRNKVRVRWYGKVFSTEIQAQIENKSRINQHNYKITKKLKSFRSKSSFDLISFKKFMLDEKNSKDEINFYINNLYPNLFVSYHRKYFVFRDIRITLDSDLKFINLAKINFFSKKNLLCINKKKIIELKYSDKFHFQAKKITKMFNNRLDKFSKYQIGLSETFY